MNIKVPNDVLTIINALELHGYTAYIVGGCVRDSLLGKEPHDYDICTSATPEQMKYVFAGHKIYDTGLKHGTLTVACKDDMYEVTTYRIDGEYLDGRHPENVIFVDNIEADLARRDFTINAMAYNPNTGLIDPFHGQEDLEKGIIRCVGDANKRFQEDALRIMRALRFAARYNFAIDSDTSLAMHNNVKLLDLVSEERKNSELCQFLLKTDSSLMLNYRDILAQIIPELKPTFDFDQKNKWHRYDVYKHIVMSVIEAPDDLTVKLAMLFHDIGKPKTFSIDDGQGHFYGHAKESAKLTEQIMNRLRFDNATKENVVQLVLCHDNEIHYDKQGIRKVLQKIGEEQTDRLLSVKTADSKAQAVNDETIARLNVQIPMMRQWMQEIILEKEPIRISDLVVNGYDLIERGLKGKDIGKALKEMLDIVIEHPELNTRDYLLAPYGQEIDRGR